jgi:alanine-glyoxylate transaminase/serine-glyoxylate transaminase/serine-pyruvate transaminase
MGYANAPMVLGTIGATEVALRALCIPHSEGGAQAAVVAIGEHFGAPR